MSNPDWRQLVSIMALIGVEKLIIKMIAYVLMELVPIVMIVIGIVRIIMIQTWSQSWTKPTWMEQFFTMALVLKRPIIPGATDHTF